MPSGEGRFRQSALRTSHSFQSLRLGLIAERGLGLTPNLPVLTWSVR